LIEDNERRCGGSVGSARPTCRLEACGGATLGGYDGVEANYLE
jgi:hypothetical protein